MVRPLLGAPLPGLHIVPGCAVLTMLALPPRLWRAQLARLGLLTAVMFALTAIGADGVPPVTQVCPGR